MKVNVINRKLIKPCTPTPESLRVHHLSLHDELSTPMNAGIILYYPSAAPHTEEKTSNEIFNRLEESLAKVLPHFYPFSGRFIKKDRLIDCSDQGVEFVEAEASNDARLIDLIDVQDPPDDLLPRGPLVVEDDIGLYPLLSMQATTFSCGDVALGVSLSHRVADAYSLALFIKFWAKASHPDGHGFNPVILPSFDSALLFPAGRNQDVSLDHLPEIKEEYVSKKLVFDKERIMALKERIPNPRAASKVRVVCAVLVQALIRVAQAKNRGQPRACIIGHSLDLRGLITNPPLPENSCGNFAASAMIPQIAAERTEQLGFEELVYLQRDAIQKAGEDYSDALARGEAGHSIFVDECVYLNEALSGGDVTLFWFSDMTKFGFYEADFGWGKPVWTSFGTGPGGNLVVLLPDKDGTGIEAWVHLDPESMGLFQQDDDLKRIVENF